MNVGGAASLVLAHMAVTLSAKNCTSSSAVMLDDDLMVELLSCRSRNDMDCQSHQEIPLHDVILMTRKLLDNSQPLYDYITIGTLNMHRDPTPL